MTGDTRFAGEAGASRVTLGWEAANELAGGREYSARVGDIVRIAADWLGLSLEK